MLSRTQSGRVPSVRSKFGKKEKAGGASKLGGCSQVTFSAPSYSVVDEGQRRLALAPGTEFLLVSFGGPVISAILRFLPVRELEITLTPEETISSKNMDSKPLTSAFLKTTEWKSCSLKFGTNLLSWSLRMSGRAFMTFRKPGKDGHVLSVPLLRSWVPPEFQGRPGTVPPLQKREKLWGRWYKEAHSTVGEKHKQTLIETAKENRQTGRRERQAGWDAQHVAHHTAPVRRFDSMQVVPCDRSQDVWWRCSICDFSFTYGTYRRSDVKSRHLKKTHNMQNIFLHQHKNDANAAPRRLINAQKAFDDRWLRLHDVIKTAPWKGARTLECQPAYHRSCLSKTGHTWYRAMRRCLRCGMMVSLLIFRECF